MKTYICIICRHKFTLNIKWIIDNIEKDKHAKICIKCQNELMNEAVYGTKECKCLNCR